MNEEMTDMMWDYIALKKEDIRKCKKYYKILKGEYEWRKSKCGDLSDSNNLRINTSDGKNNYFSNEEVEKDFINIENEIKQYKNSINMALKLLNCEENYTVTESDEED